MQDLVALFNQHRTLGYSYHTMHSHEPEQVCTHTFCLPVQANKDEAEESDTIQEEAHIEQ